MELKGLPFSSCGPNIGQSLQWQLLLRSLFWPFAMAKWLTGENCGTKLPVRIESAGFVSRKMRERISPSESKVGTL